MDDLERHYAAPNVKYEQIVRFKHIDGSTVTVRCRGKAIRDKDGNAIRMLGAHNNITSEVQRLQQASNNRHTKTRVVNIGVASHQSARYLGYENKPLTALMMAGII